MIHVGPLEAVSGETAPIPIPVTAPPSPPPEPWKAPAWLFEIGLDVGVGPLKDKHVPAIDSNEEWRYERNRDNVRYFSHF